MRKIQSMAMLSLPSPEACKINTLNSIGASSPLPSAGRHFAGGHRHRSFAPGRNTSLARSPLRLSPSRRGVGSLRAVPSSWTAIFNLPSPSTPIPISRPMRHPGCRASAMRRSIDIHPPYPHRVRCFCVNITSSVGQALGRERNRGLLVKLSEILKI